MKFRIELLSSYAVAVYLNGNIDDTFDCAEDAIAYVLSFGSSVHDIEVLVSDGYSVTKGHQ